MPQTLHPDDPRLTWQGIVSLEKTDDWAMPWRLPFEDRILYVDTLQERAATAAGCRISFLSDTSSVAGRILPADDLSPIDLCCDGDIVGSFPLAGRPGFLFDRLPPGLKRIELWLPQFGKFRLRSLELSDGASVAPVQDSRPKWVTYGSSITHCRTAESPAYTWPAIVAREMGLDLTCLGFGGNCHLEPMVARVIRDLPADCISMCVGINVYGAASLGPRTFRSAIIGFVSIVREKHPDTPYVVMSPIISAQREVTPNAVGFTLPRMRQEIEAAVNALRDRGDRHVHYVNGLDVFGESLSHILPIALYPSALGCRAMGRSFVDKVARRYFQC